MNKILTIEFLPNSKFQTQANTNSKHRFKVLGEKVFDDATEKYTLKSCDFSENILELISGKFPLPSDYDWSNERSRIRHTYVNKRNGQQFDATVEGYDNSCYSNSLGKFGTCKIDIAIDAKTYSGGNKKSTLAKFTIPELKEQAIKRNIKIPPASKKADIIKLLQKK